ncbi:hypothetical protein YC2023_035076 [Brassica napus]
MHSKPYTIFIFPGVVYDRGNRSCYPLSVQPTEDSIAWKWQTCSEIVLPIGHDEQDTMFQTEPFRMDIKIDRCKLQYGVPPRPHWVTAYYGIQDVKLILRRFGSNIIFSNGLLDPYSVGGILEDISATIVALTTPEGNPKYLTQCYSNAHAHAKLQVMRLGQMFDDAPKVKSR